MNVCITMPKKKGTYYHHRVVALLLINSNIIVRPSSPHLFLLLLCLCCCFSRKIPLVSTLNRFTKRKRGNANSNRTIIIITQSPAYFLFDKKNYCRLDWCDVIWWWWTNLNALYAFKGANATKMARRKQEKQSKNLALHVCVWPETTKLRS